MRARPPRRASPSPDGPARSAQPGRPPWAPPRAPFWAPGWAPFWAPPWEAPETFLSKNGKRAKGEGASQTF